METTMEFQQFHRVWNSMGNCRSPIAFELLKYSMNALEDTFIWWSSTSALLLDSHCLITVHVDGHYFNFQYIKVCVLWVSLLATTFSLLISSHTTIIFSLSFQIKPTVMIMNVFLPLVSSNIWVKSYNPTRRIFWAYVQFFISRPINQFE